MHGSQMQRRREEGSNKTNFFQLLLALLLIAAGIFLYWQASRSLWAQDLPLTVVVAGDEALALVQIDPASDKAVILKLPDNLLLDVVGLGSQYQAKALWRFGQGEGRAGEIVQNSVAAFAGVWVDGYFYSPNWHEGLPFTWDSFTARGVETNLSFYDRIMIIRAVSGLRSDQKQTIEFPSSIREEKTLPDGYQVVTVNEARLALLTRQHFSTPSVLSDRRTVSIANGSGLGGMARLLERMLTAIGATVVEIKETEPLNEWCQVVYMGETNGIVRFLEKRLGCKITRAQEAESRSQIEIVLGQIWGDRFRR